MSLPLLSVLVPIYKTEADALRLLERWRPVLSPAIELILLFDGESAQRERFEDLARDGHHFRLLQHEQNKGLARARKTLGQAASGKYLWHHDADDLPVLTHLNRVLDILASSDRDMLEFNAKMQRKDADRPLYAAEKTRFLGEQSELDLSIIQHQYIAQNIWNKLIRKDFWDRATANFEDRAEEVTFTLGEDLFFCHLLLRNRCSYSFHNIDIYQYFQHESSSSGNLSIEKVRRNYDEINLVFDEIESLIDFNETERDRFNFQKAANLYYCCIRGRMDVKNSRDLVCRIDLPTEMVITLQQAVLALSGTFKVTRNRLIRREPDLAWLKPSAPSHH